MNYRITTDSTCDMPQSFYDENNIDVIGLTFSIDDQEYTEGTDNAISSKEFYDKLRDGSQSATVQVNSFAFKDFVEPFLKEGQDVLHLAFSSGLSGTYNSYVRGAQELSEKYPDRKIIVVDSLAASMGEGLLLYYAVQNLKNNMTIEENQKWLEDNKLNLAHWFTVDDLMFLHRGGRVSKTSAVVGSLLGIKPILHVDNDGHLILKSKVRGRKGSLTALADKLKDTSKPDIADQMVFISHGDSLEDAEALKEILEKEVGIKKFMIHSIGAVIGAHSGPGTIALFFLADNR